MAWMIAWHGGHELVYVVGLEEKCTLAGQSLLEGLVIRLIFGLMLHSLCYAI